MGLVQHTGLKANRNSSLFIKVNSKCKRLAGFKVNESFFLILHLAVRTKCRTVGYERFKGTVHGNIELAISCYSSE